MSQCAGWHGAPVQPNLSVDSARVLHGERERERERERESERENRLRALRAREREREREREKERERTGYEPFDPHPRTALRLTDPG